MGIGLLYTGLKQLLATTLNDKDWKKRQRYIRAANLQNANSYKNSLRFQRQLNRSKTAK